MQFNNIVAKLMLISNYISNNFAKLIAEKLIEKPTLFHDWELDKYIDNKLITYKFTVSIKNIDINGFNNGKSLFVQNKTTNEIWIL